MQTEVYIRWVIKMVFVFILGFLSGATALKVGVVLWDYLHDKGDWMIDEVKQIADHYGLENQFLQLIEEMAELIVAINHDRRNPNKQNLKNIIEELADVELCLQQVIYLLKARQLVNIMTAVKISRQLERIEAEEAEDRK